MEGGGVIGRKDTFHSEEYFSISDIMAVILSPHENETPTQNWSHYPYTITQKNPLSDKTVINGTKPRNVFMKNVEGNSVTKFLQPVSFFFSIIRQLAPLNYHILGSRQVCILTGSSTHSLFLITVVSAWRHTCTSTYLSSNRISISQNREASAQE